MAARDRMLRKFARIEEDDPRWNPKTMGDRSGASLNGKRPVEKILRDIGGGKVRRKHGAPIPSARPGASRGWRGAQGLAHRPGISGTKRWT